MASTSTFTVEFVPAYVNAKGRRIADGYKILDSAGKNVAYTHSAELCALVCPTFTALSPAETVEQELARLRAARLRAELAVRQPAAPATPASTRDALRGRLAVRS